MAMNSSAFKASVDSAGREAEAAASWIANNPWENIARGAASLTPKCYLKPPTKEGP